MCSLSWSSLSLIRGSYFNKKLRKGNFRHKMGCCQFLPDLVNFDNVCHVILKKKCSLTAAIVSVNIRRKDIKVTFLSLRLHAQRFTVECTKYGNALFSYFDIFIYVSSNFTLDSRITEYLQCHIGLQLYTWLILIWLSLGKTEKNNFSSNPCFEHFLNKLRIFCVFRNIEQIAADPEKIREKYHNLCSERSTEKYSRPS